MKTRLKRLRVNVFCLGLSLLALAVTPGGVWAEEPDCHLGCTTNCEELPGAQGHCEATCGPETTLECGDWECGIPDLWYVVCEDPT